MANLRIDYSLYENNETRDTVWQMELSWRNSVHNFRTNSSAYGNRSCNMQVTTTCSVHLRGQKPVRFNYEAV